MLSIMRTITSSRVFYVNVFYLILIITSNYTASIQSSINQPSDSESETNLTNQTNLENNVESNVETSIEPSKADSNYIYNTEQQNTPSYNPVNWPFILKAQDYAERVVNGNQKPAITDTEQIMLEEQDPLKDIKLQNEPLQPPEITNVFVIETENSDEETDDNNLDDNETNDTQNNEIPVDSDLEENLKILNEIAKYNEIELDSMNNSPSVVNDDLLLDSPVILSEETQDVNTNDSNNTYDVKNMEEPEPVVIEYTGEARIFCTFGQNVQKMYKRIKEYFSGGDLCHAIVYGTPLVIRNQSISMENKSELELKNIYTYKGNSILVVMMEHPSYADWSDALDEPNKQVDLIMDFVKEFHIDGIQFSNLQPSLQDQLDTDMLCKLTTFFKMLTQEANKQEYNLQIGLSLNSYSQSNSIGFDSFKVLNNLVSWYSIETISMVKCSQSHLQGTSPLSGDVSLESTFNELIKTDIRRSKIIISIQLYTNKFGSLKPFTYIEMCLEDQTSWNEWCAARPEDFRLKGEFLRELEIRGVQLYYMESDDYKAMCDCYKFPMIRALLRGIGHKGPLEEECEYLGKVDNQPPKCS